MSYAKYVAIFVLCLALAPVVASADDKAQPAAEEKALDAAPASTDGPWVRCIPAHVRCEPVEVACPAVTRTRRVCVYEDVQVPVYAAKRTPVYREVEVAVMDCREVPVYRTVCIPQYEDVEVPVMDCREVPVMGVRRVPVYKDVEVPVYGTQRVPLTRECCDPCTGEMRTVPCGFRCETIQTGTRTVRCQDGWREEEIQCGVRLERFQSGTETRKVFAGYKQEQQQCGVRMERFQNGTRTLKVLCGYRCERVEAGTRTVRRLTGYRNETIVVRPAYTRTYMRRVCVPCQAVTVYPDGAAKGEPLPGTAHAVLESELGQR